MVQQYFRRFNSINKKYIYTDKHIHSKWTDGNETILQIANKAKELGLKEIAIVDHMRASSTYFNEYYMEIKRISKQLGLRILVGFEAKIKNFKGEIDISDDVVNRAEIKIASVHRFPIGRMLYDPKEFKKKICHEIELELSIAAIRSRNFNVLGHPGGMSLLAYKDFPLSFFEKIILECGKNGIAFEINSFYHFSILKDLKTLLKRYNIFVSLGSDAHRISELEKSINTLRGITNE